jgi:hypothetical protein
MAKLSIAVNANYPGSDGKPKTDWFDLIFWNNKLTLVEDTVKKRYKIFGKRQPDHTNLCRQGLSEEDYQSVNSG